MKTATTQVIMYLAGIVLFSGSEILAQQMVSNGMNPPPASQEFGQGYQQVAPLPQPTPNENQGIESGLWDGCDVGEGCAVCGGGYCQPPLWFTDQEVRILTRSKPRKLILASQFQILFNPLVGQNVQTYTPRFDNRKASYDVAPGYDVTIGRYLGRDSQDRDDFLELNYWGMNSWSDSNFVNSGRLSTAVSPTRTISFGDLFTDFPSGVGGFNRADTENIRVTSEMHNFEMSLRLRPRGRPDQLVLQPNGRWRRECTPGMYASYLVGMRYMSIGDSVLWNSSALISDSDTGNHLATGTYAVDTSNQLLGLQIGTDLIFRRCKWSWGVHSKVGPYIDFARSKQDITNSADGDPFSSITLDDHFNVTKQKVALIGEVGFEANYKFTPNMVGKVSYDFMWISGIALAPEQFQLTDTPGPRINTNGNIFAQGLTLGLEWNW